MLDPVTALGCASAVVQLVDFSSKILGSAYDIYKSTEGTTQANLHIKGIARHLQVLSGSISQTISQTGGSTANGDSQLLEVATKSQQLTAELLTVLQSLEVDPAHPFPTWQALRIALRGARYADKLQTLQHRLDDLRSELSLHLIYLINNSQASLSQSINDLTRKCLHLHADQEIMLTNQIEVRANQADMLANQERNYANQVDLMRELHRDLSLRIAAQGAEFRTFLNALYQTSPNADQPPPKLPDLDQLPKHLRVEKEYDALARASSSNIYYSQMTENAPRVFRNALLGVARQVEAAILGAQATSHAVAVLDSLYFDELPVRRKEIPDRYFTTYSWIFDPRTSIFARWLDSSDRIFWVNGKAGSGKSTLLKFLTDDKRTRAGLRRWRSGSRLCIISFFFWNSGYSMQKNELGMLQSLVFQVFRKCPEVIKNVSPRRWYASDRYQCGDWTKKELMDTLAAALTHQNPPTKFCFFVDGLDEFDGDHYDLNCYLASLTQSPNIKLCISSRPWNVFRSTFGSDPECTLKLETLTRSDMDLYVRGKLEEDERFRELARQDSRAFDLAQEIREKADGVFLWVFLVVRSLLRGITEQDDVPTLQRRLRALPQDLKDFFGHMLASVDEVYQEQTARSLLVASSSDEPLPVLTYYYLDIEFDQPNFAITSRTKHMRRENYDSKRVKVESSINKWCRDLLEVRENYADSTRQSLLLHKVDYLHRSVRDFLLSEGVKDRLLKFTSPDYLPKLTLCRSWLMHVKTVALTGEAENPALVMFRDNAIKCAYECEHVGQPPLAEMEQLGITPHSTDPFAPQIVLPPTATEYGRSRVFGGKRHASTGQRYLGLPGSGLDPTEASVSDSDLPGQTAKVGKRQKLKSMFFRVHETGVVDEGVGRSSFEVHLSPDSRRFV